jgi:hypothetical protein
MTDLSLAQAVFAFGGVCQGLSDAELDCAWAWKAYQEGVRFAFFRTYEELRQLAATLATERLASGPPATTAHQALAQYHTAYRDLQAVLLGVGDDLLDRPPAEGDWPLRVILGHIQAAERQFFSRIWYAVSRRRQAGEGPVQMPDGEVEAFAGGWDDFEQAMDGGTLAGILMSHDALHDRILHELADVQEEELSAPSLWWEGYEVTVQFRLHRLDSHLRQHTVQIAKTLDLLGHGPGEARRLLRLIYAALAQAEGVTIGAWKLGAGRRHRVARAIAARADEIPAAIAHPESQP